MNEEQACLSSEQASRQGRVVHHHEDTCTPGDQVSIELSAGLEASVDDLEYRRRSDIFPLSHD